MSDVSMTLLTKILLACAGAAALCTYLGCSDGPALKEPPSDKQFDDADEPAAPGQVGAVDASTQNETITCDKADDCPQRVPRCLFREADGCGAKGTCAAYSAPAGCKARSFCGCAGGIITGCMPDGLSPVPVLPGACNAPEDAGTDAVVEPPDTGAPDAGPG